MALVFALQLLSLLSTGGTARLECAKVDRTRLDIDDLQAAPRLRQARTGAFPGPAAGFEPLWGDAFRHELVDGRPVVTSFGADGLPGVEGIDADIWNRSPVVSAR